MNGTRFFVFCAVTLLQGEVQSMQEKKKSDGAMTTQKNQTGLALAGNITLPQVLYKILMLEDWERSESADRVSTPSSDDSFIHFATEKQIDGVINKKFADCSYVVLRVNPSCLFGVLVLEWDHGGIAQYYHLYDGHIPKVAVAIERMCVVHADKKKGHAVVE